MGLHDQYGYGSAQIWRRTLLMCVRPLACSCRGWPEPPPHSAVAVSTGYSQSVRVSVCPRATTTLHDKAPAAVDTPTDRASLVELRGRARWRPTGAGQGWVALDSSSTTPRTHRRISSSTRKLPTDRVQSTTSSSSSFKHRQTSRSQVGVCKKTTEHEDFVKFLRNNP